MASDDAPSDRSAELTRLAREYAEQDIDLYDLLGVDALTATTRDQVHRAWRKRSLKHHPDKAGAAFDPTLWSLLERARDVLSDVGGARAAYDAVTSARMLRRREREEMDRDRRRLADDLETRERAAVNLRDSDERRRREAVQKERDRLAAAARRRDDDLRAAAKAEQDAADLAEARRRVREKREEKTRRRNARVAIKASVGGGGGARGSAARRAGPPNGVVDVPGIYLCDTNNKDEGGDGAQGKRYWELVCDKLRAVQAVRDLKLHADGSVDEGELARATQTELEARRRIYEAEMKFQQEATVS